MALPKSNIDLRYQNFVETKDGEVARRVTLFSADGSAALGASGAGGGNNSYSTEQLDFTAEVTDSSNDIVLSVDNLNGAAITIANFAGAVLKVYDAINAEFKTITLDKPTWNSSTKTLGTADCDGAFTFTTGDVVSLALIGPDKAYVAVNNANQVIPLVLDSLRYTTPEPIIAVTNVAAATYRVMFSMKDFSNNSIQWALVGGASIKLYTTNDGNDDTTAIGNWQQDVSGDAPSGTDTSGHYFMDTKLKCLNMMIEYITTDATNAIDLWVMKGN